MSVRFATAATATSRAVCQAACDGRIAACVATGDTLRRCRKSALQACRAGGIGACVTTITHPTTTTTSLRATTTTVRATTSTSTTTLRATTTTTRATTTTIRATTTTVTAPPTTTTTLALPRLGWVRRIGNDLIDAGAAVVVDGGGNRVLGGAVSGVVDFGGGAVAGYESDAFVAKYTAAGAFAWARRWGSAGTERVTGLGIDGAGNVVVAGTFAGTIDFGAGPLVSATGTDTFVVALSPSGTTLWSDRLPVAATALAVRADGTLVLAGTVVGAVDFGAGLTAALSNRDAFVAQYAPNGALAWVRRTAATGSVTPKAVAVDAGGTIAVTGYFSGAADLGGAVLTSVGGYDLFVASYSPAGALRWARRGGGSGTDDGHGVAIDAGGAVVVTGYVQGVADMGTGTAGSGAPQSLVLARYAATGQLIWSHFYGSTYGAAGNGVAIDRNGNAIATGSFQGAGTFGGALLTSAGIGDIVVGAWSSGGLPLWSMRYGGTLDDRALAIGLDGLGHPVVTGSIDYFVDFGAGPVLTSGNGDVFVLSLQ